MVNTKLFTIIIDTYNRPSLLKKSVSAALRQTHSNLELILVNNGATDETISYLHEIEAQDRRVKLIHFAKNQFSLDDPQLMIDVCLNAALNEARGDYVWYQADDDVIADDYAEKMVALFQDNPECTTAAGLPEIIDIDGNIISNEPRQDNIRPRYMPGNLLTLDSLQRGKMFGSPAVMFTVRRDVLINAGGYHRSLENSQLYGIVPFGITGFDESAILHVRNHSGQLNKLMMARGWMGIDESISLIKDWSLKQRWEDFGTYNADNMVQAYKNMISDSAARWFVMHLYSFRIRPAVNIFRKMWFRTHFWKKTVVHSTRRQYYAHGIRPIMKVPLKYLIRVWPGLTKIAPVLERLNIKAERCN